MYCLMISFCASCLIILKSIAVCEHVQYFEIVENLPPGTKVGYIDIDNPPYLIVSVPGSAIDSDLSINQITGEIKTRISLDRELRSSYSLVALPHNLRVVIKVLDENDNAPSFSVEEIKLEFPENSPQDSKRALPPAKDPDLGQYSTQSYIIVSGNYADTFKLAPYRGRDGVLYLDLQNNGFLDRESKANYHLLVEALDGGSPPLRSQLSIIVTVQDVNDNPPIFQKNRYEAYVPENATIGSAIITITACDADSGDNSQIEYSINRRQSDREEIFNINSKTGIVFVNKALDFESRELHELVIVARDQGAQPLEASTFLAVHVCDVNDNKPIITVIFLSDDATPKISESAQFGESVARISVSDPDSRTKFANVSVSLNGGEGDFELKTRDNVINLVVTKHLLNRERQSVYNLTLVATDTGTPPLRAEHSFILQVIDVNDNAPEFDKKLYETHIINTLELDSTVLRVKAKDPDEGINSMLKYSILNSTWFYINEDTGLVKTKALIDCKIDAAPIFIVVVSDLGNPPLKDTAVVNVIVHDIDNDNPVFEKPFYNVTVPEDLNPGNCFLKVKATDINCGLNSPINYSVSSSNIALNQFLLRSNTGEVCVNIPLDREIASYFELSVIATDTGGLQTSSIIQITVTDINDNHPIFQPHLYNVTVKAYNPTNSPFVRCFATDADSGLYGQIFYKISNNNEKEIFKIHRITGEISMIRKSRLMIPFTYFLNVSATDAAGLKNVIDATVQITVIPDRKDLASCDNSRYIIRVKENIPLNFFIKTIKYASIILKRDEANKSIHFRMEESGMSLDKNTGIISTKQPLDREACDHYVLSIESRNNISYGYCQVEVEVEDVNDNSPFFQVASTWISIPESYPLKTVLYVAHAKDLDIVPVIPLHYDIVKGNNQIFKIDIVSGEVYLMKNLDYEMQQRYQLLVRAFDGSNYSNNLSLHIEVQDVNDNLPMFEKKEYFIEISESAKLYTQILRAVATDIDTGNNARISYQLHNAGPFRINSNNGWIEIFEKLDREKIDHYYFTVIATDNGLPSKNSNATISILVLDENDNNPCFKKDLYTFRILENLYSGALVGKVSATDADKNDNALLRFTIVQSKTSFAIDSNTGVIMTCKSLDREEKDVHELVLEVRDQGQPPRFARVPVQITVLDVNDNSPIIIDPKNNTISIREEQSSGTQVTKVRAVDYDLGENASIKYTILKDSNSRGYEVFDIDNYSGIITTKDVLSYREKNIYELSVKASDEGNPIHYSIRNLHILVLASTDNRPTFNSCSFTFNVKEDSSIGFVVGKISAIGITKQSIYTLNSQKPMSHGQAFIVDPFSGQIILSNFLDRENINKYELEIQALDTRIENAKSVDIFVKIYIDDVNDNYPKWSQDLITIEISENTFIGTNIYNFSATDLDENLNSVVYYSLVAVYPLSASFHVDLFTGALILVENLDREEFSEYTLIVKAEDRASISERLASTITVRLFILDENDNYPKFIIPITSELFITPNAPVGLYIIQIIAVDADTGNNGRISYKVSSDDEEKYFTIDNDSGILNLAKSIHKNATIEIIASDHGMPPRRSKLKLSVIVATENISNYSSLLHFKPVIKISENFEVGVPFVNVSKISTNSYGTVSFRIPDGIASDKFTISNNGLVSLKGSLDYEEKAQYLVPVLAQAKKLLDFTTLEINLIDENDNKPLFLADNCNTLFIPENEVNTTIHTFKATDVDTGENGEVFYIISSGNSDLAFTLDPLTGVLSISSPNREVVSKYELIIVAKDKGQPHLETSCNITVNILDINDNAPTFIHNEYSDSKFQFFENSEELSNQNFDFNYSIEEKYSITVLEDIPIGSSVMQVEAVDPDLNENGKIIYLIESESTWLFYIDNITGIIKTTGFLDRERQDYHKFLIKAIDCGKYRVHRTYALIEIRVIDVNDNYPVFLEYPYVISVPISTKPGQNILQVIAYDVDYGKNSEIFYSFSESSNHSKFQIHPTTGKVSLISSLVEEIGNIYQIKVFAVDKGYPPMSSQSFIEFHIGNSSISGSTLKFTSDNYEVTIPEDSVHGFEIIRVTAIRSDGRRQRILYSIGLGNENLLFNIEKETGKVKVADSSNLDAESVLHKKTIIDDKYEKNNEDYLSIFNKSSKKKMTYILTLVAETVESDHLKAYAKLIIHISDVNDNAPIFTQLHYLATVFEGNAKDSFIMKVSAYDMDQGLNSQLLYHIVDGNIDNAFTISPSNSGLIRTNIVLDREIKDYYHLTIIATDQGNPQLTGTTTLIIIVIDINDNQPTLPQPNTIFVSEETLLGTSLTTIRANDVDSFPMLTYRFSHSSFFNPLSIDRFNGRIILLDKLDAEIQSKFSFQIIASDGVHEVTANLTLLVKDANDNIPSFNEVIYSVSVTEDEKKLKNLLAVNASDNDLTKKNNMIRYSFLHPVEGFSINSTTGIISVNLTTLIKPWLYRIELMVIAKDSGIPILSSQCIVLVNFHLLTGNMLRKEYKVSIKENITKGSVIVNLSDIDLLGSSILNEDVKGVFKIFMEKIYLIETLDREKKDRYIIMLGFEEKTTTGPIFSNDSATITINVVDVNDNHPIFMRDLYQISIKENARLGQILITLHAEDNDLTGSLAATIVYYITSGNHRGFFHLDKLSGNISVSSNLDCDISPEVYHLIVMACDSDSEISLCSFSQLHVHLEDVNDNSPKFPVLEYKQFIDENEPINTEIFRAHASDLDRNIYRLLNYSILPFSHGKVIDNKEDWKLFSINDKSGIVMTKAVFDYEIQNQYNFILKAIDLGGRSSTVKVSIEIGSQDEFYPQFTESIYYFNIIISSQIPSRTVIGHIIATDRDKGLDGRVLYHLNSHNPFFELNRTSGALIFKHSLVNINHDLKKFTQLIVFANSGKLASLSNTTKVEISLIDSSNLTILNNNITLNITSLPTNINVDVTTKNSQFEWLKIFLVFLLLLVTFGSIFSLMLMKKNRKKKAYVKSDLKLEGNVTVLNSCTESNTFDSIPVNNIVNIEKNVNNCLFNEKINDGPYKFSSSNYDQISLYHSTDQDELQANSNSSVTEQSGSSGRGSAEDDGYDEELRMINEVQRNMDSESNLSVQNTQDYLARLGILDIPKNTSKHLSNLSPFNNRYLFEDEVATDVDIATQIYGKIENMSRSSSSLEIPHNLSLNGSFRSIVYNEETLAESYNWNYLLDWEPQYQPLADVFNEIAILKNDITVIKKFKNRNIQQKSAYEVSFSPISTSKESRLLSVPIKSKGIHPRSPISHDFSISTAAALSPNFSPSLSPLATKSPSISPLIKTGSMKNQSLFQKSSSNET